MAALDTFFLIYQAETKSAEQAIDQLETAASKPGEAAKVSAVEASEAFEAIGDAMGKSLASSLSKIKKADEEAKKASEGAKKGVSGVDKALGQAREGAKAFGSEVAGQLSSMSGGMGNLLSLAMRLGPVMAVGALAAAALATGIKEANKAAENAKKLRDDAWASDVSQEKLIRMQIIGERQGVSAEEMTANVRGISEKIKSAYMATRPGVVPDINNPEYRRAMMLRQKGVRITSGGNVTDMEDIYAQMVKQLRTIAKRPGKKGGEERAMAVAVQEFGMTINAAEKIIKATDEQIKKATSDLEKESAARMRAQVEALKLAETQTRLDNAVKETSRTIAQHAVPAMNSLLDEFTKTQANGESLATTLGKIAAAMINATTHVAKFLANFIPDEITEMRKAGDFDRDSKYWKEAEEEVKRADKEKHGKLAFFRSGHDTEIEKVAAAKMRADPESPWSKRQAQANAERARGVREESVKLRPGFAEASDDKFKEAVEKAISRGATKETLAPYLQELLRVQNKGNQVATANWKESAEINKKTPQIGTSLDQAMALWASGIGKASGLKVSEDKANQGMTRAQYEAEWKASNSRFVQGTFVPAKIAFSDQRKPMATAKEKPEESRPLALRREQQERPDFTSTTVKLALSGDALTEHFKTASMASTAAAKVAAISPVADKVASMSQETRSATVHKEIKVGNINISSAAQGLNEAADDIADKLKRALQQLVNSHADPVVN